VERFAGQSERKLWASSSNTLQANRGRGLSTKSRDPSGAPYGSPACEGRSKADSGVLTVNIAGFCFRPSRYVMARQHHQMVRFGHRYRRSQAGRGRTSRERAALSRLHRNGLRARRISESRETESHPERSQSRSLRFDRRSMMPLKCELAIGHDELKAGLGLLRNALGTRQDQ
jgi:hypothetical protein